MKVAQNLVAKGKKFDSLIYESKEEGYTLTIKEDSGLRLFHYADTTMHPSRGDFWKGIILDGQQVVAQSFPWTPTITVTSNDQLPSEYLYTPFHECTILRFYRHMGVPAISTHKQINIVSRDSRVSGNSRPFIELVNKAISSWPKIERQHSVSESGENIYTYTPEKWEDLCIEGMCNVFLLIDRSNQITNQYLSGPEELRIALDEGVPLLLHAITFTQGENENEFGVIPMIPYFGIVPLGQKDEDGTVCYYKWHIPCLPIYYKHQAEEIIAAGGGVIGFSYETPEFNIKYLSPEYARKLELAGDTFSATHRFTQLYERNVDDALEYINNIPPFWGLSTADFLPAMETKIDILRQALVDTIMERLRGETSQIEKKLYERVKDIINPIISSLRKQKNLPDIEDKVRTQLNESLIKMTLTEKSALARQFKFTERKTARFLESKKQ